MIHIFYIQMCIHVPFWCCNFKLTVEEKFKWINFIIARIIIKLIHFGTCSKKTIFGEHFLGSVHHLDPFKMLNILSDEISYHLSMMQFKKWTNKVTKFYAHFTHTQSQLRYIHKWFEFYTACWICTIRHTMRAR